MKINKSRKKTVNLTEILFVLFFSLLKIKIKLLLFLNIFEFKVICSVINYMSQRYCDSWRLTKTKQKSHTYTHRGYTAHIASPSGDSGE